MSSLGIDQMYLLAKKFEKMGWGSERVTQLGQAPEKYFHAFEAIMDGRATSTLIRRLTTPTTFTLPAVKKPKRLRDCKNVWMSPGAITLFGTVSNLPAQKRRQAAHCDLIEALNDLEIIEDLGGEQSVATSSVVTLEVKISQLVTKQADGKSGELLNDGANRFYLDACKYDNSEFVLCVRVIWFHRTSLWSVFSNAVHAGRRMGGSRVFLDS